MEDVAIQTDHVDSQELLNLLIQQHIEQESKQQGMRRHSGGEGMSSGLMKHYPQQQQDPDAIHRLTDGGDVPRSEVDQALQQNPTLASKARSKQQPSRISFARGSKKCPSETNSSSSYNNNNSGKGGKHESESLSDRICQVVWSRKESAPFVTPLASKRTAQVSSARRGTAPNVPLMRHIFEPKASGFEGRSQSFKGSSSSGSVRKRMASYRDPLSRRASGDTVPTAETPVTYRALLHPLKAKNKACRRGIVDCDCIGEMGIENDSHRKNCRRLLFGHNNFDTNSLHSSVAGSGQNLSSPILSPAESLRRKLGGLHVHGGSCKSHSSNHSHDGEGESMMRRQVSMTLSIPSREDSVRSCSSSKSYGSYSANTAPVAPSSPRLPCTSSSISNAIAATSKILAATSNAAGGQMKPSMGKLVRYGSNPDVSSSRRTNWKQRELETLHQPLNRGKLSSPCRSLMGSSINIESMFPGGGMSMVNSSLNLAEKKKQILSQKNKRNEKVAWAVHLGFSSLLILAITCIVVFLRLSSDMAAVPTSSSYYPESSIPMFPNDTSNFNDSSSDIAAMPSASSWTSYYPESSSPTFPNDSSTFNYSSSHYNYVDDDFNVTEGEVRKENENLLQSIQPQLNLHNLTTPQPSTHTHPVYDNSNGNEDSGQSNDKGIIPSLQSGQSLTRTKEEVILSSSSSSDSSQDVDGEGQQKSNNATTHENLNIMSSSGRGGEDGGDPIERSNNDSSKVAINSNNNINPSIKSSIRPKRSKSRPKTTEESGGDVPSTRNSNLIILTKRNEKVHTDVINDTPNSGLMKARHLESTIFRFLKNSSGSGMRERRNLESSRKL